MSNSAFDRGLETADEWFAAVAKRLDANRPYLVPSQIQAILKDLSQNERPGFVEGLAVIIVASYAWGPACPGGFKSADAYRLMQMTPAEQNAEDKADAARDAATTESSELLDASSSRVRHRVAVDDAQTRTNQQMERLRIFTLLLMSGRSTAGLSASQEVELDSWLFDLVDQAQGHLAEVRTALDILQENGNG